MPPRLILLPGLACDASMFASLLPAMPPALQPTVVDVHTRFASIEAMAAALVAEQHGDLILCGASMGSIIAMEVVHQAPERIKGLILLGANAQPETEAMRALREGVLPLFAAGRAAEVLQFNLPLAFHPDNAKNKALTQSYLDMILRAGGQQLIAQNRAIMARPDARLHLPLVRCPALMVCGDSDQLTTPENAREITALVNDSDLRIIAQCGHMLTMEQPETVNICILKYLKKFG